MSLRLASIFAVSAVVLIASVSVTVSFQQQDYVQPSPPVATSKKALDQTWKSPTGQIVDRSANQQLNRVIELIRQDTENKDYIGILRQLQHILQAQEDAFVTSEPLPLGQVDPRYQQRAKVSLRSLKSVAEQIINELPKPGRDAYNRLYGVEAATISKRAVAANDLAAIKSIAREQFHTEAGYAAAYVLGTRGLEQNRPVTALRHLERLRETSSRKQREPLLSLKITAAWLNLGRPAKARETITDLLKYAGRNRPVRLALDKLLGQPAGADKAAEIEKLLPVSKLVAQPTNDWPVYMGDIGRSAEPVPFSPIGKPVWNSPTLGFFDEPTQQELALYQTAPGASAHIPQSEMELAAAIKVGLDKIADSEVSSFQSSIPAAYPLVSNGIAVFRTLNRVRAVEIHTGELLWETFTEDPSFVEQFDLGSSRATNARIPKSNLSSPMNRYQESFLTARTRTDRTTGTLSCDGELVYYIEGCGIPDQTLSTAQRRTGQSKIKAFNRLCAVELETGLLRWEIGGPRNEFSLSSAGRYFLGPPTPVEDELFVIAEEDAAIRLIGLSRTTGDELWAQSISQPHGSVAHEGLRRVSGDMPTFVDGMLICPTSSGQVVAFDVAQRRFVWNFQYESQLVGVTKAKIRFRGYTTLSTKRMSVSERWADSAVVSHNGRLLITPLDTDSLFCLDVQTGTELWRIPRQSGSYLASVHNDSAIIVGSAGVLCIHIKDGEQKWFVPLEYRRVSGRGLRTGHLFHLPIAQRTDMLSAAAADEPKQPQDKPKTQPVDAKPVPVPVPPNANPPKANPFKANAPKPPAQRSPEPKEAKQDYVSQLQGGILTIDVDKGVVLAESGFPLGTSIGNLAASDGVLISQSFDSVLALESLDSITKRVELALKKNPKDAKTLALQGQLAFHQGHVDVGMDTLIKAVDLGAGKQAQDSLLKAILERLRFGGDLPDEAIQLLEESATGRLKFTVKRIRAEAFVRQGEFKTAFETLLELSQEPELKDPKFQQQMQSVTVIGQRWVSGRMKSVYEKAYANNPESVLQIDALVQAELDRVLKTEKLHEYNTWLAAFSWHPLSRKMSIELAGNYDPATDFLKVERHLTAAINHSPKSERSVLKMKLLEHWLSQGAIRSVTQSLDGFVADAGEEKLGNGQTAAELVGEWKAAKEIVAALKKPNWKQIPSVERKVEVDTPRLRVFPAVIEPRSPAIKGLRFELDTYGSKFRATDENGNQVWEVDIIRMSATQTTRRSRVSYTQSKVLSRGHLVALSMGTTSTGMDFYVFDVSKTTPTLSWSRLLHDSKTASTPPQVAFGRIATTTSSTRFYSLDAMTNNYMVYRQGNTLYVVDPLSGSLIWQRANIPTNSKILADENHIAVLSPTTSDHSILSMYDGQLVKTTGLPAAVLLANDGMIVTHWATNPDGTRSLISHDAISGKVRWQETYPSTAMYRMLDDSNLVAVGQLSGQIRIHRLTDGKLLVDVKGEEHDILSNIVAWSSQDHYVIFMSMPSTERNLNPSYMSNLSVLQHRVHGLVYGVAKKTGEIKWTRDLPNTLFHTKQPSNVPFFVLASYQRRYDPITRRYDSSKSPVKIVDSRTGDTIFESDDQQILRQFQTRSLPAEGKAKVIFDRFVVELDYNKELSAE